MWAVCSTLRLVVATLLVHQIAAAHEITASYPPQVAQHLDIRVDPCNDFYQFACGGYSHSVQMPSKDATRYSLYEVQEKYRQGLLKMLQSNTSVASKYFDSCMNTTRINELGLKPLQQVLKKIDAVKTVRDLFRVAGELTLVDFNFLVELSMTPHEVQATKTDLQATINVLQMTPAFRIQDDYLSDGKFASIEPEYRKYISTVLTQAQIADSATVNEHVNTIVNLGKAIANIKWSHPIDPVRHTRMTFGQASSKYPLAVKEVVTGMFAKAGVPLYDHKQPIIIRTKPFLDQLENIMASTNLNALKTLMKYQYIHAKNDLLGDQFTAAAFDFHSNKIKGGSKRPTREQFCVDFILKQLPNRMGKEYAALTFDTESANVVKDMDSRIKAIMKQHLLQTDWFDEPTREKALEKLDKVISLIGYSEEVEPINEEKLSAGDFFGNTESIQRSMSLQQIQKLSKPDNRREWDTTTSEVKTIYHLNQNVIVIPAGILQPPNFNKSYPAAINYGATATSIAHELIHAFDESGGGFDGNGNMKTWWTKQTTEEFEKRSKCLVDQYSNFDVVSDTNTSLVVGKLNGVATFMETFADVSGFAFTLEAYQKFMEQAKPPSTTQHKPLPEMDLHVEPQPPEMDISVEILPQEPILLLTAEVSTSEMDPDKLFYVAYAQSRCASTIEPYYLRVNGVIMNDKHFGNVFKCPVGTKMNPKDKCPVW